MNKTTRRSSDELADLAKRWHHERDQAAAQALVDEFMPYMRTMIRGDRATVRGAELEDLEAEAAVLILEYLGAGGEAVAAKVGAVVRGRLRRLRNRPVKYTDGEERVTRVASVISADAEAAGEHLDADALRERAHERCMEWARVRTDDDAAAHRKLVQRGVTRALRDIPGLLAAASCTSLDALSAGGTPLVDTLAAPEASDGGDELVELLVGHFAPAEREAVLWMCGIGGDARTPRGEIAAATGIPVSRLAPLLKELAGRARSIAVRWALLSPDVEAAFVDLHDDPVDDLLELARH